MQVLDHQHRHLDLGQPTEVFLGALLVLDQFHGHRAQDPLDAVLDRVLGQTLGAPHVWVADTGCDVGPAPYHPDDFLDELLTLIVAELRDLARHGWHDTARDTVFERLLDQPGERLVVDSVVLGERCVYDRDDSFDGVQGLHGHGLQKL